MEDLTLEEANQRLASIKELCDEALRKNEMLVSSKKLLLLISAIAEGTEELIEEEKHISNNLNHVIISCDASITENPGGQASIGYIIQYKNESPMAYAKLVKAKTNNQAEYDAIYEGLITLMNLKNAPNCPIEVRSDSKIAVDQINNRIKCNDTQLLRRRDLIQEYIEALPVPVTVTWRPRNSTPELKEANYIAQDLLQVKRH